MSFRAGAAATNVDPPLGLPMVGVVRRHDPARERLGALEVTAAAFERGPIRVVVCGVDTLAIQSPEVDAIRERIAAATGASRAGVLLNWNHTHHAPPCGRTVYGSFGERDPEPDDAIGAYVEELHDPIVETCKRAFDQLEVASARWGLGQAELAVNRRQRDEDGQVRKIGWHPGGLVDRSVPVLQSVRKDGIPRPQLGAPHGGRGRRRAPEAERPRPGLGDSDRRRGDRHRARRDLHRDRPGREGALTGRRHLLRRLLERLRLVHADRERVPARRYEPGYGHKTYGLPAQVSPETDKLLVETGVRLVVSLFPERPAPAVAGVLATGALPVPPPSPLLERP